MAHENEFRTEDLALVTFLKISSIEPVRKERKGKVLCWIFEKNADLREYRDEYIRGEAHVEVKECVRVLAQVRRDMYDALDFRPSVRS